MRVSLGIEFVVYGLGLAGLGILVQNQAPEFGRVTLWTSLCGGILSLLWGGLFLAGHRKRWWIILTLAALVCVLMGQVVQAWMTLRPADGTSLPRSVAILITLMLALTYALLMNLLHGEGRKVFGQPAAGAVPASPRAATSRK